MTGSIAVGILASLAFSLSTLANADSLLPILGWKTGEQRDTLFIATLPLLAFTLLAKPEIGAFRDWDILSLPAVPLTLWALLVFLHAYEERRVSARAAWQTWGACAIHTIFWIGLNADAEAAEARFDKNLVHPSLDRHAATYGWETLAAHYRASRREEAALGSVSKCDPGLPGKSKAMDVLR